MINVQSSKKDKQSHVSVLSIQGAESFKKWKENQ